MTSSRERERGRERGRERERERGGTVKRSEDNRWPEKPKSKEVESESESFSFIRDDGSDEAAARQRNPGRETRPEARADIFSTCRCG